MDQIDINLIKFLQLNGRISITDLSKKVSLSRPSVKERIRKLKDAGIIEGFTTLVSSESVGRDLLVMIELSDLRVPNMEFEKMISQNPYVIECHRATGHVHYYIKASFNGAKELTQLIENLIPFGNTKTSTLLDTLVNNTVILPYKE